MHADILVLYKVRHQRFPKFTWYTVYTYKTTKFFKCIKGSLSECIQQILESCGDLRLEYRSSSAAAASVEREQRHWGAETNPQEFPQTQLDWLHDLHVFPEGATGWLETKSSNPTSDALNVRNTATVVKRLSRTTVLVNVSTDRNVWCSVRILTCNKRHPVSQKGLLCLSRSFLTSEKIILMMWSCSSQNTHFCVMNRRYVLKHEGVYKSESVYLGL